VHHHRPSTNGYVFSINQVKLSEAVCPSRAQRILAVLHQAILAMGPVALTPSCLDLILHILLGALERHPLHRKDALEQFASFVTLCLTHGGRARELLGQKLNAVVVTLVATLVRSGGQWGELLSGEGAGAGGGPESSDPRGDVTSLLRRLILEERALGDYLPGLDPIPALEGLGDLEDVRRAIDVATSAASADPVRIAQRLAATVRNLDIGRTSQVRARGCGTGNGGLQRHCALPLGMHGVWYAAPRYGVLSHPRPFHKGFSPVPWSQPYPPPSGDPPAGALGAAASPGGTPGRALPLGMHAFLCNTESSGESHLRLSITYDPCPIS
jgi:hypothetical protein